MMIDVVLARTKSGSILNLLQNKKTCKYKFTGFVFVVGGAGFEPAKVSQRIYSPSSLAA
jgi:hypothetical protein